MIFLEKDLEQIIFETDSIILNERGLPINGKILRQLKIGKYGVADLVTIERKTEPIETFKLIHYLDITVYELKKDKVNYNTFFQALKYVKGINSYLESRNKNFYVNFNIVLVGKNVDKQHDFIYLPELMNSDFNRYRTNSLTNLNLYEYEFTVNGIEFKEVYGYDLINKGF